MDLTDAQWQILEPIFRPRRRPDGRGRPWHDTRAVVNGVLWAAFHIFYHTTLFSFVSYIPGCCALAYVAQRTRSTWPGVIGHTIANSMFLLFMVRGITGV